MTAAVDTGAPEVVELARAVSERLGWTYLDALEWSRDLASAHFDLALMMRALRRGDLALNELGPLIAYESQRMDEAEDAAAAMLGDPLYFARARAASSAVVAGLNARLSPDEIALAVVARLKEVGQ